MGIWKGGWIVMGTTVLINHIIHQEIGHSGSSASVSITINQHFLATFSFWELLI